MAAAKGGVRQVRRPWLGATLQPVSREIAESLGLERPAGALVADMVEAGPAAQAGLRRGDVVMEVDGLAVDDPESLGYRLGTKSIGATATLTVQRNGRKLSLPLKLTPAPETPPREALTLNGRSPFSGVTVVNLSPAVTEEFSIEAFREGVVIAEVEPGSAAANVGLQKGDVILAVNDAKIARTSELQRLTQTRRSWWKLTLGRGGQIITTALGG